jgi:hypothetical protein
MPPPQSKDGGGMVWFNVQVVEAVQAGTPSHAPPPAGPFESATLVYRALEAVHEAERRLSHLSLGVRNAYAEP